MTGYPEIDAILDRARDYRRHVCARLGYPPSTFLVTAPEYRLLQGWRGENLPTSVRMGAEALQLFGMRVIQPEHASWSVYHRFMEHAQYCPIAGDPLATSGRTDRPPHGQPEILCPCGEVIWAAPPSPVPEADSEHSSFDEWSAQVEVLLAEYQRRRVAEGERL